MEVGFAVILSLLGRFVRAVVGIWDRLLSPAAKLAEREKREARHQGRTETEERHLEEKYQEIDSAALSKTKAELIRRARAAKR